MDYVTRQFINVTKKLRNDLRKGLLVLHRDLEHGVKAINDQSEITAKTALVAAPTPIFRAELQIPETIEAENRANNRRNYKLQKWLTAGTWLAFIAAASYAYLALRQWGEMISARHLSEKAIESAEKSVTQSRLNSYQDQRAWLSVVTISGKPETKKPFGITIEFTNSGKTPAVNGYMWNTVKPASKFPNILVGCSEALRLRQSRMLIAPNAHPSLTLIASKELPEGWEKASIPEKEFFVYGCMVYDDVFAAKDWEHRHWITFCGVIPTEQVQKSVNTDLKFQFCKTGNDTGDGQPPTAH
jgi:hypothetical protein